MWLFLAANTFILKCEHDIKAPQGVLASPSLQFVLIVNLAGIFSLVYTPCFRGAYLQSLFDALAVFEHHKASEKLTANLALWEFSEETGYALCAPPFQ